MKQFASATPYDSPHIKKTVFMGAFEGIVVIVGEVVLVDVISINVPGEVDSDEAPTVIIVGTTLDGGSGATHVMPAKQFIPAGHPDPVGQALVSMQLEMA